MNITKSVIYSLCSVILLAGCTDDLKYPPVTNDCKTDFSGFPDIPGWNFIAIPVDSLITSIDEVYFLEEKKGILCTNRAIWLTKNDGVNWEKVFSTSSLNVYDISFPDQLHGFISVTLANNKKAILKTNDGGENWTILYHQPENWIVRLSFVDSLLGFASLYRTGASFNARTINGGVTWEEIPGLSTVNSTAPTIQVYKNGFGYIPGDNGEIHLTSDLGENWTTIQTGLENLYQIQFLDKNSGFVSDYGNLYKTTDGGETWTVISEHGLPKFHFFNLQDGFSILIVASDLLHDVFEDCSAFLTTTDGGITWIEGPPSAHFSVRAFNFINSNLGYAFTSAQPYTIAKLFR